MELIIEAEFATDLHKYLSTRPYSEVGGLCRYIEVKMSEAVEAQNIQQSIIGQDEVDNREEADKPRGLVRGNQPQSVNKQRRKRR